MCLHNFDYGTRNKRNIAKAALENFWFSWLFLCARIYLLYWHSFWLELMILNIFQIYFKMSSQKVEVWIFLWYFLIHEDFKFLILTVSFQRNLFKFCIMRVIVGTKMCFYFQKIVPVNTPFIGWNWCLQLWIFHSKWLMQICNLCYDVIKKIWPFFILSFLI